MAAAFDLDGPALFHRIENKIDLRSLACPPVMHGAVFFRIPVQAVGVKDNEVFEEAAV